MPPAGIPGAESTSITLLRDDRAYTAAHHGDMALAADELQYAKGYGPCMDAGRGGVLLRIDDMRTQERWPDYVGERPTRWGVRSSLSIPLPYQGTTIGALNIYSTAAGRLRHTPGARRRGLETAEVVAVAVANAEAHWGAGRAGPQHEPGHAVVGR